MKVALCITASLLVAGLGGCIPSAPMADGEMDRLWGLTGQPTQQADLYQPTFGDVKLPARWIIRQNPSVIWSTVSIVRAFDGMKEGRREIDFSVSPTHTQTLVDLLAEARRAMGKLAEMAEMADRSDRRLWASKLAEVLVQTERISRMVSLDEDPNSPQGQDPQGLAAGPLLHMVALYLNEHSAGSLLADMSPDEIDRLRSVLTQLSLRVGFALAGKQLPPDLRETVTTLMRQVERFDMLESSLKDFLLSRVDEAPPAGDEEQLAKVLRIVTSWTPRGLKIMEAIIKQWDRMDSVEVEFAHFDGRPIVSTTVNVLPGKEVRVADAMIAQPTMLFRGSSKIIVIPEAGDAGETVVLFEPSDDGCVELRFEGLIYGLVRMFAFPLADGRLREVRVFSQSRKDGYRLVHVAMLTEALADKSDPRRMMVFQDIRKRRTERREFSVGIVEERKLQSFSYITPLKRYTYNRAKVPLTE